MKIRTADLGQGPFFLEQVLPPNILELNEKSLKVEAPIHVRVTVYADLEGGNLIVQGSLKTTAKLECGRCVEWIDWPVEIPDFIMELKLPQPPVIDLTPQIREDIILHLPFNAACRLDAENRCPLSGKVYPPASTNPASIAGKEVWQELDKLKIKEQYGDSKT